ncbi:MAG: hypothetical protein FJZ78_10005 [Bacteroidetes bacterium]|nr:hypothetical protein [Bacteroidota bacterium]
MKKLLACFIIAIATNISGFAQLDQIENLIKGSKADTDYLVEGYLSPLLKSVGYGLNQGWYNTAKPHKSLGMDLTVTVSLIAIPDAEKTFQVDNSKLNSLQCVFPSNGAVPTIFGSSDVTPQYKFKGALSSLPAISGPSGIKLPANFNVTAIPVPIANLSIGIIKGTDIKIRYIPTIEGDGFKLDMIGGAIMHDIKQHIPGIKSLPFDLSVLAGFTTFKLNTPFGGDKEGVAEIKAMTVQAIVSKKVSVLTGYAAVGYGQASSSFDALGTYELGGGATLTDPVSLSQSSSGPRMTAGLRVKLGPLAFHGDYTLQKFPTTSVGVGLGFR